MQTETQTISLSMPLGMGSVNCYLIEADAGLLMRRRAHLGAGHIEVWADVKKKHSSHALTADLTLREIADILELPQRLLDRGAFQR